MSDQLELTAHYCQKGENLAPGIAYIPKDGQPTLMKGNEALAEASIAAGCHHYFGYPITPQTEIPSYLSRRLPEVGGCFLQAESELASINMVMGASATGMRAMTTSSSPGISLMQEAISDLSGSRLPTVIANVMRGGPGLGNITGAQGDYNQAVKGGGNGDYRCIVLAPSCSQDIAELTMLAFDLADRYRIVTILLLDGFLGQMSEPLTMPRLDTSYQRPLQDGYILDGAKQRPGRKLASIQLAREHRGLQEHVENLFANYREIEKKESRAILEGVEGAKLLLCAYGMPTRQCREVQARLSREGISIGLFQPITLWPFPEQQLHKALTALKHKNVLVVEMSHGQFADDVKLHCYGSGAKIDFYGTVGGATPEINVIIERIKNYV